jgi:hypothetical protein
LYFASSFSRSSQKEIVRQKLPLSWITTQQVVKSEGKRQIHTAAAGRNYMPALGSPEISAREMRINTHEFIPEALALSQGASLSNFGVRRKLTAFNKS